MADEWIDEGMEGSEYFGGQQDMQLFPQAPAQFPMDEEWEDEDAYVDDERTGIPAPEQLLQEVMWTDEDDEGEWIDEPSTIPTEAPEAFGPTKAFQSILGGFGQVALMGADIAEVMPGGAEIGSGIYTKPIEDFLQEHPEYQREGAFHEGIRMATQSLTTGAATGVALLPLGPHAALAGFFLGGAAPYAVAEFNSSMREFKKAGITGKRAVLASAKSAFHEGFWELATGWIQRATFGASTIAKAALKPATKSAQKATMKNIGEFYKANVKQMAKRAPVIMGSEMVGEAITAGYQAEAAREGGLPSEEFWDAAVGVLPAVGVSSIIIFAFQELLGVKMRGSKLRKLTNAKTPVADRKKEVELIEQVVGQTDPVAAQKFADIAYDAIEKHKPIPIDQEFIAQKSEIESAEEDLEAKQVAEVPEIKELTPQHVELLREAGHDDTQIEIMKGRIADYSQGISKIIYDAEVANITKDATVIPVTETAETLQLTGIDMERFKDKFVAQVAGKTEIVDTVEKGNQWIQDKAKEVVSTKYARREKTTQAKEDESNARAEALAKAGIITAEQKDTITDEEMDVAEENELEAGDKLIEEGDVVTGAVAGRIEAEVKLPERERRVDAETRKRLAEMTREEMMAELHTDPLTGLRSRRAYEDLPTEPFQASIDVDSLKAVNDNYGHDVGDEMLRVIGQSLGTNAFHISGDEFIIHGKTKAEVTKAIKKAKEFLVANPLRTKDAEGNEITIPVDFSYGIGETLKTAELGMRESKKKREKSGEKPARGELPKLPKAVTDIQQAIRRERVLEEETPRSLIDILINPSISESAAIVQKAQLKKQVIDGVKSGKFAGAVRFGTVDEVVTILKSGRLPISREYGVIHAQPILGKDDTTFVAYGAYNKTNMAIIIPEEYVLEKVDAHTKEVLVDSKTPPGKITFLIGGMEKAHTYDTLVAEISKDMDVGEKALLKKKVKKIKEPAVPTEAPTEISKPEALKPPTIPERFKTLMGTTKVGDLLDMATYKAIKSRFSEIAKAYKAETADTKKTIKAETKAKYDKALANLKIAQKVQKSIKSIMKPVDFGKLHVRHAEQIIHIQEKLDATKKGKERVEEDKRLREAIKKDKSIAKTLSPEALLRIQKTHVKELTVDEIVKIAEQIESLREKGAEALALKHKLEKAESDDICTEAAESVEQRGDMSAEESLKHKTWATSRSFTLRIHSILDKIDKTYGKYGGPLFSYLYGKADTAVSKGIRSRSKRIDKMNKVMKRNKVTLNDFVKPVYVNGIELTKGVMYGIHAASRDLLTREALLTKGTIMPVSRVKRRLGKNRTDAEKTLSMIAGRLTTKEKQFINAVMRDLTSVYPSLREAIAENENRPLGFVENYFPAYRVDRQVISNPEQWIEEVLNLQKTRRQYVDKRFMHERVDLPEEYQTAIRTDIFPVWFETMCRQEHYLSMGGVAKKIRRATANPILTSALRKSKHFGESYVGAIKHYSDSIANPNFYKDFNDVDDWLRAMRKNVVIAFLSYNLSVIGKQLPSAFFYLRDAGPAYLTQSIVKTGLSPVERYERMIELDPQMSRHGRAIERELQEADLLSRSPVFRHLRKTGEMGLHGIKMMDRVAITIGWNAVFDKAIAEGKTVEEATVLARRATLTTQPAAHAKDLAQMYSTNEFMNWVLMFTNQLNQIYNMTTYNLPASVSGGIEAMKEGEYAKAKDFFGRASMEAFSLALGAMVIWMITRLEWPDEPEDVIQAVSENFVNSMAPVGKTIMSGAMGYPAGLPFFRLPEALGQLASGRGTMDSRVRNLVHGGATIYGVPVVGITRAGKTARALMDDPEVSDLLYLMGKKKPKLRKLSSNRIKKIKSEHPVLDMIKGIYKTWAREVKEIINKREQEKALTEFNISAAKYGIQPITYRDLQGDPVVRFKGE